MTDPQILYISKADIINNNCELNLSGEEIAVNACIAVIGSITDCNAIFDTDTLRLFKSKSLAEKYIAELLSEESIYIHAEVLIQEIE